MSSSRLKTIGVIVNAYFVIGVTTYTIEETNFLINHYIQRIDENDVSYRCPNCNFRWKEVFRHV